MGNKHGGIVKDKKNTKEYTVMLVGRTGAGKSSLGNFLLQRESFEAGDAMAPITASNKCECRNISGGITLRVIDTPGFGDFRETEKIREDLANAFYEAQDGVDAFLYVISAAERVGRDLVGCFQLFEKLMSHEKFYSYVIPIFTKGDLRLKNAKERDIYSYEKQERLISKELENEKLQELKGCVLQKTKHGWICISSSCKDQFYYDYIIKQLFYRIDEIRRDTGHMVCTSKIMEKAKELTTEEKEKNKLAEEEERKRSVIRILLCILINSMSEEFEELFGGYEKTDENEESKATFPPEDREEGACGTAEDSRKTCI